VVVAGAAAVVEAVVRTPRVAARLVPALRLVQAVAEAVGAVAVAVRPLMRRLVRVHRRLRRQPAIRAGRALQRAVAA
jgi:hypothetical protein